MANPWKLKKGTPIVINVIAVAAIDKGSPAYFVAQAATQAADGGTVDIVMAADATAGQTDAIAWMPNGEVFEVKVATGTQLYNGDDVFLAASNTVDDGSLNQQRCGTMVDYNPGSGGCAQIAVWTAKATMRNYGDASGT